jgi:hypothetical protein
LPAEQLPDEVREGSPEWVLKFLPPDLIDTLASLNGAPVAVARATVQLLPFGSRAALEVTGLATAEEDPSSRRRGIELTPLAFEVMALAANCEEADPERLASWSERAAAAVIAVTERVSVR